MKIKTLIHTALVAEAKPVIGYFGLTCKAKQPYNLYENEDIALIVSGMGEMSTKAALTYALTLYQPQMAINVGIAGCKDISITKGTLFCTTHPDLGIPFATLSSHQGGVDNILHATTTLVDMEAESFLETMPKGVKTYIFKVVSDHCDGSIPSKIDVGNWINKSLKFWGKYGERSNTTF